MKRAVLWIALAAGAAARVAAADTRTEAIVLHDQGIKDMKAGQLDKACAELQASLELVRDSGTKGALATCHGLAGRIATSWLLWRELSDTAPSAELRSDAAAHAQKLEPRLPRYTITLAKPMPDLVVELNGKRVATTVSVPVPVDPGPVTVRATRRNGELEGAPWVHDYVAVERQTVSIEVPALAPVAAPVAPPPVKRPAAVAAGNDDARHRRHVIGAVVGGAALAGFGVGGFFGYEAYKTNDDAKKLCGGDVRDCAPSATAAAQAKVSDARHHAQRSNIAFAAGGALALTAVIVWVTAPSATPAAERAVSVTPWLSPTGLGAAVEARF